MIMKNKKIIQRDDTDLEIATIKTLSSLKRPVEKAKEQTQDKNDGQLACDVYQTKSHFVVIAPIAGVKLSEVEVAVKDEILTIKGKRDLNLDVKEEDYITQECFWGTFSRSIILPQAVETAKIQANFKDGILEIKIPKVEKIKSKIIKIKT
jgi:HSP20 family protein